MPAVIHVDLDGAREIFAGHGWTYPSQGVDPVFSSGMRRLLEFLRQHRVRATLFVVAHALKDSAQRALLEEAVADGHEIASHSLTHQYLTQIEPDAKRREIAESRVLLERALGVSVQGFRAPGYRIDRDSLELLGASGYLWDSSAFPTRRHASALACTTQALRRPHRPLGTHPLIEWSLPDYRPLPLPFQPSYSLLLGDWLFRAGIDRHRRLGQPLTLLFHLIDFADPLPTAMRRGLARRIFTLSTISGEDKAARCSAMLAAVRMHYRLTTTAEAITAWQIEDALMAGTTGVD